jgi:hypothetical protein
MPLGRKKQNSRELIRILNALEREKRVRKGIDK